MAKILNVHSSGAVGTIIDCPIISPLPGTLFCYGQTLNAVTNPIYQPLYNAIGNQYGGTDNTNFVIPDLRGYVTAGKDNMGGVAANRITSGGSGITGTTLGAAGGSETHALTVGELANHGHQILGGLTGSTLPINNPSTSSFCGLSSNSLAYSNNAQNGGNAFIQPSGSGSAHTSTQPTHIVNKAICYY